MRGVGQALLHLVLQRVTVVEAGHEVVRRQVGQAVLDEAAFVDLLAQLAVGLHQLLGAVAHALFEVLVELLQLAHQAASLEVVLHAGAQFVGPHRLGQVVVAAGGKAAAHVVGLGGDEDDRHFGHAGQQAHAPAGLEAVDAGHHHVEQHEIRLAAIDQLQRALAAGGCHHIQILPAQHRDQQIDVLRRVVDDQQAVLRHGIKEKVGGGR